MVSVDAYGLRGLSKVLSWSIYGQACLLPWFSQKMEILDVAQYGCRVQLHCRQRVTVVSVFYEAALSLLAEPSRRLRAV
jgi:hypothetical protein